MTPLIRAVIDTAALRANLETVRTRAPGSKVMAVVKANAYGHGLVMTAVGLPQADAFAVARLEEGIMLREAGITRAIILLEGVFGAEQLLEAAVHRFEVVVHDPLQIALLEAFRGAFRFYCVAEDRHRHQSSGLSARGLSGRTRAPEGVADTHCVSCGC